MPQPHFTITINGSIVAGYAALVSTLTGAVQIAHFLRDRKNVKLKLLRRMSSTDPRRAGMTFAVLTATNVGRRPVNITHTYFQAPDETAFLPDTNPRLPCELTEGKELAVHLDEAGLNVDMISFFAVIDSTSREYKLHLVPWHKRAAAALRRRLTRTARS
jgi:hypothetical protein